MNKIRYSSKSQEPKALEALANRAFPASGSKIRSAITKSILLGGLGSELLSGRESLAAVPQQPTISSVRTNDYRLHVKDRLPDGTLSAEYSAVIKGICWQPSSVNTDPTADPNIYFNEATNWFRSDIAKMRDMGKNVVRLYNDFGTNAAALQILDCFYTNGIKVLMPVDSPRYGVVADNTNVTKVVNFYKNHPAILGWGIGNEPDLKDANGKFYFGTFNTLSNVAQWVESTAQQIKALDTNHAVFCFIADPHIATIHPLSPEQFQFQTARPYTSEIVNILAPSVDVWGAQVYRNWSFGELFLQWASISTKPLLISEYGADAYNFNISAEDQATQSRFDVGLWDEITLNLSADRASGVCIGGCVFEFQDQWEKNGTPGVHSISTEVNYGQPDQRNQEEWFGLFDNSRNMRAAVTALKQRYALGQSGAELNAHPILSVNSSTTAAEFLIDSEVHFSRGGGAGGGRGITVAVLDSTKGIRFLKLANFDTYYSKAKFTEIVNLINSLPNGSIISFAICDEGGISPYGGNTPYGDASVQSFLSMAEGLGSTSVRSVRYWGAWAFTCIKGQGKLSEAIRNTTTLGTFEQVSVSITNQLSLNLDLESGLRSKPSISTVRIPSGNLRLNVTEHPPLTNTVGLNYTFESTPDLKSWTPYTNSPVSPTGTTTVDVAIGGAQTNRFFRVLRNE